MQISDTTTPADQASASDADRPSETRALVLAVGGALAATAAWVVLAWRTPTSTFHFAPIVAAAIGAYVAKSVSGRRGLASTLRIVGANTAIVVAGLLILIAADRLQGPTFWSEDGAPVEAALFTAIGALIGVAALVRRRDRAE